MRTHRHVDRGKARHQIAYRGYGRLIIRVHADKKLAAVITIRRKIALDHVADNVVFAPQRHKDRDPVPRRPGELGFGRGPNAPPLQADRHQPAIKKGEIQKQIVETAEQDPDGEQSEHFWGG